MNSKWLRKRECNEEQNEEEGDSIGVEGGTTEAQKGVETWSEDKDTAVVFVDVSVVVLSTE